MKSDQLKRGNEIEKRLKELKEQRAKFENLRIFLNPECVSKQDGGKYYGLDCDLIDFPILKTITIARIDEQIKELETEFINL